MSSGVCIFVGVLLGAGVGDGLDVGVGVGVDTGTFLGWWGFGSAKEIPAKATKIAENCGRFDLSFH
jgi:hypothetical protein